MAALKPMPKFKGPNPFPEPPSPEQLAEEGMSKPSSRSSSLGRSEGDVVLTIKETPEEKRERENREGNAFLFKTIRGRGKKTRKGRGKGKKARKTRRKSF
jgi:hypothetical protein